MASSSGGNCTFIGTERTRILVDCGLSRRETIRRLAAIGEDPARLTAIVITHEHCDHVAGLAGLARALKIPAYLTHRTAPAISWAEPNPRVETFQAGTGFTIGDIEIGSFTIPHDAIDPVGYCIRAQGIKVSIATDLGYIPDSVCYHMRESHFLLLESNHDLDMLKVGPYPWSIKQRVMGRRGHLCNEVAAGFVRDHLTSETAVLMLGHLSEHNNHPEIARNVARRALDSRRLKARLIVADPGLQETFLF